MLQEVDAWVYLSSLNKGDGTALRLRGSSEVRGVSVAEEREMDTVIGRETTDVT